MKHIALGLSLAFTLLSSSACKKSDGGKADDKAAPAGEREASPKGDKAAPAGKDDFADVDCEKMTTHNVEVLMKEAVKGKTDDEAKQMMEAMKTQHATMVKACEDEKGTKKLTHKQYDCILAASTTTELAACVTQ